MQVTKALEKQISNYNYNFINLFVHKYFNIQLIYLYFNWGNPQINSKFSYFTKLSLNRCGGKATEFKKYYSTISNISYYLRNPNRNTLKKVGLVENLNTVSFKEWLAGLVDGDGHFQSTKKGFSCLKIIMGIKDKKALYTIKNKYGGSIKKMANSNSLKYKLKHPKNLIKLINDINGNIRNPSRILQLYKISEKFNLKLKEPQSLTYNNGWFSGFIDSDGSIYIDEKSGQLVISVTQKNRYLLEPLQILYGGRIQILSSKDAFQYSIYRKDEILKLVNNYFNKYPLKSGKESKINLIENFYQLGINSRTLENNYKKLENNLNYSKIKKLKDWIIFKNKWDKL